MNKDLRNRKLTPSREIAYIAVMCALLIGGQYALSFVTGAEIVTLLLVCFSYVFGAGRGAICALAFSLLRCIVFPFSPTALMLYLIYYPALASVFGGLGHVSVDAFKRVRSAVIVNLLLSLICVACAVLYGFDLIKVSRIYKITVYVLLWVIFSLCGAGLIAFDVLFVLGRRGKDTSDYLKVIMLTGIASVCTVCFTLLDDIITPLFYGYTRTAALAYFYASFTAMLPQTVCTIVTVSALFLPLTAVLKKTAVR